ncbi:hypothetical protein PVAP13_4KG226900 [Panicum virgatum]|uniref:Protein kinase domain-containing protein n=1 Tax=Panicum virgatum TaxID=38727 RepID=A0A8T0TL07_PANVG|nr:hypothetical protein PVAP13_4KG226900 [Panicum virgatum]
MDYEGNNLRHFLQTNGHEVLQRVDNNYGLRYFTENEIRHITDGYTTILGEGAFGQVYKGKLDDQSSVAVKKYKHGTQKEVFAKEVIVHSQINHKNVVRLLGCCTEENALMIVMEFISNGNLNSILHSRRSADGHAPFPLEKRLNIAIEVAEVLWCMHSMYSPVLHGDIKPANILLDENLTPKISDFGIARLLCANGAQHTRNIIGSIGYLDPTFCENGILTPKSDVYSFGVVLLEMTTRKKAVDGTITLAQCFSEALAKGENMLPMFDKEISGSRKIKFLGDIGQLAAKCLLRDVKMRPEMVEVVTSLRMIRKALQREEENMRQKQGSVPNNSIPSENVGLAAHQFGNLNTFNEKEMKMMTKHGNLNTFNEKEMKMMTKDYRMTFREELGECLYNGVLGTNRPVIVRQVKTCSESDRETFLNTMSILSKKNHKNVANIVGFHLGKSISECLFECCCELSMSKFGSILLSHINLYDTICSMEKLPLHLRLSIAVQCAEGLVHIHSLVAENPGSCGTILFGNFRSANIFLDKNFVPKIFNANLSIFLGLSGVQQNTISVFPINDNAPEKYYSDPRDVSQPFNPKYDVYSFGVVLLELITWRTVRYIYDGRAHVLTKDFIDSYGTDCNAIEIFGKVYDEQGGSFIHEAIAIAVDCLQVHIQKRPEMNDVLSRLRIIASAQSIRSKLTAGGNNKPSQPTGSAPVNNTEQLHPTIISTISLDELNEATRNFSNDVLIGQGLYTKIFLGVLNGKSCAVKKLDPVEEIQVEVSTISRMCNHDSQKERKKKKECVIMTMLHNFLDIFWMGKFVSLLMSMHQGAPCMIFFTRVKIAISSAKGLEFLHLKADPSIIHTNIKSSNILIFDDDCAKIGDVGVFEQLTPYRDYHYYDRTRPPHNVFFHQAPECIMTGKYSRKTDVYSFGVVLLELLTGRKLYDNSLPHGQWILVTWAKPRLSEDMVKECVDPRLGGLYPPKAVAKMAAVAALCLQHEADYRPEMSIVVKALSPLLSGGEVVNP